MDSITMYNMNFKDEIDAAYDELGLIPINGQDVAVDRILTEFFINNKKKRGASCDSKKDLSTWVFLGWQN